ncbi:MAG: amidohydrolase, partial [Ilumatobacteraceae bacterium]
MSATENDLGFLPFDCDNHYYEALDAFTRHLDPKLGARCVQWAEIDG